MKRRSISKKMLVGVLAVLISATLIASAGLLTYYGQITTTANVDQSVVLSNDGGDTWLNYNQPISYQFDGMGGDCEIVDYLIKNRASVEAPLDITTAFNTYGKGSDGVTVTYYEYGYEYSESINIVGEYNLDVTVEESASGNWLIWTFDFPVDDWEGDGQLPLALIIAKDGEPLFQIHNNDGTDSTYGWGDWLYSPWGPTIDDGWNGWHSGTDNTPVGDLWWVTASGEYYAQGKDGILQVSIHKSILGDTFHWAAYPQTGGGWYSPYKNQQMPTPVEFSWSDPLTMNNYHEANFWQELITPFTLQPGETMPFRIEYCFALNIMPGRYDITSQFVPN